MGGVGSIRAPSAIATLVYHERVGSIRAPSAIATLVYHERVGSIPFEWSLTTLNALISETDYTYSIRLSILHQTVKSVTPLRVPRDG